FIVVAARDAKTLPAEPASVSLFTDVDESELKRADDNAREVLRLDALLRESNDAVARHTGHIHHLEALVLERDRLVAERDAVIAGHVETLRALETQVAERDGKIATHEQELLEANAQRADREA